MPLYNTTQDAETPGFIVRSDLQWVVTRVDESEAVVVEMAFDTATELSNVVNKLGDKTYNKLPEAIKDLFYQVGNAVP